MRGRKRGREAGREGGREGGREEGREGGREGEGREMFFINNLCFRAYPFQNAYVIACISPKKVHVWFLVRLENCYIHTYMYMYHYSHILVVVGFDWETSSINLLLLLSPPALFPSGMRGGSPRAPMV